MHDLIWAFEMALALLGVAGAWLYIMCAYEDEFGEDE